MLQTLVEITPEELFETLQKIDVGNPLCTYSLERCKRIAPLVNEIRALKAEKNALLLAHTYVHPDIIYGAADHTGDSYGLSKMARDTEASLIVFAGVRFMAETAKILNPSKVVIDPNPNGGCTLADSIDAEEVLALRRLYPRHTFACYINTTACVKAACDLCVTSSNVEKILENYPSDRFYFLPDRLMAENVREALRKKGVKKEILAHPGTCYVHEEIDPAWVAEMKKLEPTAFVLAHPECSPAVVAQADQVGSTSQMHQFVVEKQREKRPFLLLTECGVASRLRVEAPEAKLIGGCFLCKYMRSNSLSEIAQSLREPKKSQVIEIEKTVLEKARRCIERMFEYAE